MSPPASNTKAGILRWTGSSFTFHGREEVGSEAGASGQCGCVPEVNKSLLSRILKAVREGKEKRSRKTRKMGMCLAKVRSLIC